MSFKLVEGISVTYPSVTLKTILPPTISPYACRRLQISIELSAPGSWCIRELTNGES
jgi:hypothetical protein